uniref:MIP-T3 domain-containing protein n=1 Tax=Angiostrongylus cantonensis TaxID=6313 RepID=A0A0K0DPG9_ANGCA
MVNAEGTRTAFLGLIDRPPLTDQLLARPPFRFILDIVKSTVSKTGYLKDQFSSDDLNPSKFNDKNSKVAFLDSLLQILNDGSLDNVKSSKIVAGKEPELTNLMLIKLAEQARAHTHGKKSSRRSSVYQENSEILLKTKRRSKSKELRGENSKTHNKNKHAGEEEKKTEDRKKRSKSKDREGHDRSTNKKVYEGKKREKTNHTEKRKKEADEKNRDINSNLVKHQVEQEVEEQNLSEHVTPKGTGDAQALVHTEGNEVLETNADSSLTIQER